MTSRLLFLTTGFLVSGLGWFAVAHKARTSEIPFYRSSAMSPEWLPARDANASATHRIAAFRLIDQHENIITERALAGKLTVVHFFFTGCGDICPNTTSNIVALMAGLPANAPVQVLSHSVLPNRDSTTALRRFAAERGVSDPRWHLLTGDSADINRLARNSYFTRIGDGRTYGVAAIAHTESVFLVDSGGRLRGVYAGTLKLEVDRLAEDIRTLLAENGQ